MLGEFDQIHRFMAPLAQSEGAMALKNDGAVFAAATGHEIVVTTDTLIADVHFFADDNPADIAAKLIGVNLSDLAAMGATPLYYTLNTSYNDQSLSSAWIRDFSDGLAIQQARYGISLLGGDTTRTRGPLVLSLTAFGQVPVRQALPRTGAKTGDLICVSGTIGDSALGLALCQRLDTSEGDSFLIERYRRPQPRVKLGIALRGIARTCLDISDGLLADLGHMDCGAALYLADIPLSTAAQHICQNDPAQYVALLSGGDDYELLFTIPAENRKLLEALSRNTETAISVIGHVTDSDRIELFDQNNQIITPKKTGYRHF